MTELLLLPSLRDSIRSEIKQNRLILTTIRNILHNSTQYDLEDTLFELYLIILIYLFISKF